MADAILGIICEYNPFHLGHQYHLDKAKSLTGAKKVIAVMSGPFTQRGDAALFSPAARAEMALVSGVDLVFELPALFSVREADFFAMGGTFILNQLGCTHIAFGCETDDLGLFDRAGQLLSSPTDRFQSDLHAALKNGCSYARAQGEALSKTLGTNVLSLPNNVLALCYLNALKTLKSPMIPVPIKRIGDYHNVAQPDQSFLPSATALRSAVLRGNWHGVQKMTTNEVYRIIQNETALRHIHRPDGLSLPLRTLLLSADAHSLSQLPGCDEGLDRLILKYRDSITDKQQLLEKMKSKRYTYTRLNRLVTHFMLNATRDHLPERPHYARLLGLKPGCTDILRQAKESGFPIIEKAAAFDRTDLSFQTDMRAYDLWALGAGLPFGEGFRQSPLLVDHVQKAML